jgi:peptidoglycan/xylan/chitin deacetylase (PgdA/CDA1 family)
MLIRTTQAVTLGVAVALGLTGCSLADESATGTPASRPTPTQTRTPEPARLALVDPSVVTGMSVRVEENLDRDHLVYSAFPVIPGLESWTDDLAAEAQPRIERFIAETPGADSAPFPELMTNWNLVAASPALVGLRIHTTQVGGDAFDGSSRTVWFDIDEGTERPAQDLLAPGAEAPLIERVREAAAQDPSIDAELLEEQLVGERESFDALAFTPEGRLWVEFDRTAVSEGRTPTALAVSEEGLLSPFGRKARQAALAGRDPGLEPTVTRPGATTDGGTIASTPDRDDVDCSQSTCAALTFDDGPVAETSDLLDVLAEKGVPATFFVVGTNAQANPRLLARMAAEGHVVGNHTLDHPQLTRLGEADIRAEIEQTNDIVQKATGQRPTLLRPPYGETNDTVAAVTRDLGMAQIIWNVDPEDWKDRDSAIVTERVLADTTNGSIVLSHDIHDTTRAAYAAIIDGLTAQGFTLVTVPDLLDDIEPGQVYYSR